MARLIDADALQNHIGNTFGYPAVDILHEIANFPTVDAVPVAHGRWKHTYEGGYHCAMCTACGVNAIKVKGELITSLKVNWSRCPNCGAHMDLEVE